MLNNVTMSLKNTLIVKTAIWPKLKYFLRCCNLESKLGRKLRTCISCHDTHMCQESSKSRGSCISGVSVLQKVTLNVEQKEKYKSDSGITG